MYETFYGLDEEPFRLTPDSRLCFKHPSYKNAKAYMQYALYRREGFVVVTGQPGTGKSTLISDLTSEFDGGNVVFTSLNCTQVQADDLIRLIAINFQIDASTEYKSLILHSLKQYFLKLNSEGRRPLLIIDEAQDLPEEALEELRLLTNLQHNNQPLLQIFLVGQSELRGTIAKPQLVQLHQRIVATCHLEPLSEKDTAAYILYRLKQVGWNDNPSFAPQVFPPIHQVSRGIPRIINLVCSRLLLHGMVDEKHHIDTKDLKIVLDSLVHEELIPSYDSTGMEHTTLHSIS
ncbi:AAA family ATPase [Aestuariicella hydrocarbonica]|uniref:AAA family ATPase n=1 Tax=Pseudomaricurvus hydrocarbonicus TaxID=1470433 RepID=A0A9E5MK01_9GAMM|nr:AAA family ATPase [Aestuariicella hydrocarbonica]NHO64702.1 AAA family ATPase [Aestuariicella hydrocarbonica]